MKHLWPALALGLLCSLANPAAGVEPGSVEAYFRDANAALDRGAPSEAIDLYELMADNGLKHPDASFNRAIAYVRRAESKQARPGDLGRAAGALSETLMLRPDDTEAADALRLVREEIGRRRAREGAEQVIVSPSLARSAVAILEENTWAILAGLGSALLTTGLALRLWWQRASARLSGGVLALLGGCVFVVCAAFAGGARYFRMTSRPAVVVASEARLLDETGKPKPIRGTNAVAEGESVYVVAERGALAKIEWGTTEGYVNRSQLMLLSR
ncbi:MAG TPA: hypothetical protein VI197_16085 [Polyangiaceae bacterium]